MEENLFELRLYLYDSTKLNGLGTELQNVMIGSKISSCLDDTLDTAEITLNGITTKDPYKPLTKFVAVLTQGGLNPQYFHYELRYDLVEKLSMSENLYRHTLSLGNPAISCQKRTCDNFAISYRLKDVTLDVSTFDDKYINKVALEDNNGALNTNALYPRLLDNKYAFGSSRDFGSTSYNEFIGGKYINWQRKQVGATSHIIASNDMTDLDKLTQNVLINSSKMTSDDAQKYVDWLKKSGISSKMQIFDYDSTNKVYGVGSTYEKYFESVPNNLEEFVSNGKFKYKIPYCMMWLSDSYNNEITTSSLSSISYKYPYEYSLSNRLVLLPTITTITATNLSTNGQTTTIIKNIYGKDYQKANGFQSVDFPYYLDVKSVASATTGWRKYYCNDLDLESMVLVGFDEMNYGDYANNKIITPIYLKAEESNVTEFVEFTPQANYTYTISTRAYFGENGVDRYCFIPTDDMASSIKETLYNGSGLANNTMMNAWHYRRENQSNYMQFNIKKETDFDYIYEITFVDSKTPETLKILKSQKSVPNCYDLFLKSQIASSTIKYYGDTTWENIPNKYLPYVISNETRNKLTSQQIIEDKYYNKNLWEMFMQIGKYIHAKPYIKFYDNKYELAFKDYGISEQSSKEATQNSIFSSYNVESYISSLDNYLENYFEYGNELEEYLRPTDNDGSSICTNDNCVLKTKYPIEEITYLGVALSGTTSPTFKDITDYIYEYNVYKCLNVLRGNDYYSYAHYKGNSIYYHLGERSVEGFQYCEPTASGVNPYAIKRIIAEAFSIKSADSIQINDYCFYIKYRTKDDTRFKTFKPDIRKFMKSSSTDQYPIQTQFNNQSDKIVDSQKYGNNVYGTLLRSGNEDLEYQEYITDISLLKDSGELYNVNDNLYYVSKVTYAIYPTYINSQVNYTKDFNKLSEIIGIDSSPRFYEIPEDSSIKRNISVDRLFCVGTSKLYTEITNVADKSALERMYNNVTYKYCSVDFYGAKKSYNTETNDYHTNVCVPCVEYATANTLTLECDMEDNFGAGDQQLDVSEAYKQNYMASSWILPILSIYKVAYSIGDTGTVTERKSIQYCDMYGKADLVSFIFFEDIKGYSYDSEKGTWSYNNLYLNLPNGNTNAALNNLFKTQSKTNYVNNYMLGTLKSLTSTSSSYDVFKYVLDKDARETIGINFNIHLVTGSDNFVLSNNVFRKKKDKDGNNITSYYWYYLSEEVNKFERTTINQNAILAKASCAKYDKSLISPYMDMRPVIPTGLDLSQVNAIAFGYECDGNAHFIIARNVTGLTDASKKSYWYFTIINN